MVNKMFIVTTHGLEDQLEYPINYYMKAYIHAII